MNSPLDNLEDLVNEPKFDNLETWPNDCVFLNRDNGKWYFWDESYFPVGPYDNEHETRVELEMYVWICLDTRSFGALHKDVSGWYINKELDKL